MSISNLVCCFLLCVKSLTCEGIADRHITVVLESSDRSQRCQCILWTRSLGRMQRDGQWAVHGREVGGDWGRCPVSWVCCQIKQDHLILSSSSSFIIPGILCKLHGRCAFSVTGVRVVSLRCRMESSDGGQIGRCYTAVPGRRHAWYNYRSEVSRRGGRGRPEGSRHCGSKG